VSGKGLLRCGVSGAMPARVSGSACSWWSRAQGVRGVFAVAGPRLQTTREELSAQRHVNVYKQYKAMLALQGAPAPASLAGSSQAGPGSLVPATRPPDGPSDAAPGPSSGPAADPATAASTVAAPAGAVPVGPPAPNPAVAPLPTLHSEQVVITVGAPNDPAVPPRPRQYGCPSCVIS
jgi:hypothetical protein